MEGLPSISTAAGIAAPPVLTFLYITKRQAELHRFDMGRAIRPARLRRLRVLQLKTGAMSTSWLPHCEQTSRFLHSGTVTSAP